MFNNDDLFFHLKKSISRESKIVNEMLSILEYEKKANPNEKQMFYSQINSLNETLNKTNKEIRISQTIKRLSYKKCKRLWLQRSISFLKKYRTQRIINTRQIYSKKSKETQSNKTNTKKLNNKKIL